MRWLAVLILIGAGLAGCADDAPAQDDDFDTSVDDDLEATDETGVIRGVVVDATITPIADAKVILRGAELETQTSVDGAFGFSDLDPGTYFIDISKPGFNATQTSTTVVAGVDKPDIVRVILAANPSTLPFFDAFSFEGFLECGAYVAICGLVSPSGNNRFLEIHEVRDRVPDWLASELMWESTQTLGDELLFEGNGRQGGNWNLIWQIQGPSPLQATADHSHLNDTELGKGRDLQLRVFAPLGSVVLDQRFTVYTHLFYGYTPGEDWRFSEADPPAPPA